MQRYQRPSVRAIPVASVAPEAPTTVRVSLVPADQTRVISTGVQPRRYEFQPSLPVQPTAGRGVTSSLKDINLPTFGNVYRGERAEQTVGTSSARYEDQLRFGEASNDRFVEQFRAQQRAPVSTSHVFTPPQRTRAPDWADEFTSTSQEHLNDSDKKWREGLIEEYIDDFPELVNVLKDPRIKLLKPEAFEYFAHKLDHLLNGGKFHRLKVVKDIEDELTKLINSQDKDYPFDNLENYFQAFESYFFLGGDKYPIYSDKMHKSYEIDIFLKTIEKLNLDPQRVLNRLMEAVLNYDNDEMNLYYYFKTLLDRGAVPNLDILFNVELPEKLNRNTFEELIGNRVYRVANVIDTLAMLSEESDYAFDLDVSKYYDWDSIEPEYWEDIYQEIDATKPKRKKLETKTFFDKRKRTFEKITETFVPFENELTQEEFIRYVMMSYKDASDYLKNPVKTSKTKQESNAFVNQFVRMEDQRIGNDLRPYLGKLKSKGKLNEKESLRFDELIRSLTNELYVSENLMSLFDPFNENSLYNDEFVKEKLETLNVIPTNKHSKL